MSDEYLSGNVRDKLRIAEVYQKENPELFGINAEALKNVQPKRLDASEIDVRIGTTWIEPQDYEEFIYELLKHAAIMVKVFPAPTQCASSVFPPRRTLAIAFFWWSRSLISGFMPGNVRCEPSLCPA